MQITTNMHFGIMASFACLLLARIGIDLWLVRIHQLLVCIYSVISLMVPM